MPDNFPIGSVLVDTDYRQMVGEGRLTLPRNMPNYTIEPDSLDLYLGRNIYQVTGIPDLAGGFDPESFLNNHIWSKFALRDKQINLRRGNAYLAKLDHQIKLNPDEHGIASGRSSIGRTDVTTLLLAEGSVRFNEIPAGYNGNLWLLFVPQSFSLSISWPVSLNQLRIHRGTRQLISATELRRIHHDGNLIANPDLDPIISGDRLMLRLDLSGKPSNLVPTNRNEPVRLLPNSNKPEKYWVEKPLGLGDEFWLEPGEFALLKTLEVVKVPTYAVMSMIGYDDGNGEYRTHYAAFVSAGWCASLMCEVRNLAPVPICLQHGMIIASLEYEYLTQKPQTAFENTGSGIYYHKQTGIKLPGWFAPWE
ncbi:MAG: 2'-deoxycytidine 5'-triphosphate deaminase [Patescibacteria group bacterium]